MVLHKTLSDREYRSYFDVGAEKTAVRVNDATISTNKLSITSESVTFGTGTNKTISLDKAPIYNSDGSQLGSVLDTSIVWGSGTATQVAYKQEMTDIEQFAEMSLHSIAIDYDTGRIRYKKLTSGTVSDTVSYASRQLNIEITSGSAAISIGDVKSNGQNIATETTLSTISTALSIPTTLTGGSSIVAVPGTAVPLGTSLAIKSAYVRAKSGNTGNVYVGNSGVDKDTDKQIILTANDSITLDVSDRYAIFVDADVASEGVDYVVMS